MTPPTFRTANVTSTSMRLHYEPGKNTRVGLSALVVGIIKGLAEFHLLWPPNSVKISQEKFRSKGANNDIFLITWKKIESTVQLEKSSTDFKFSLSPKAFNAAFPFHLVINKRLIILQIGSVSIRKTSNIKFLLLLIGNLFSL
jgi:hypothetical protein